jgi:hypothetical protein
MSDERGEQPPRRPPAFDRQTLGASPRRRSMHPAAAMIGAVVYWRKVAEQNVLLKQLVVEVSEGRRPVPVSLSLLPSKEGLEMGFAQLPNLARDEDENQWLRSELAAFIVEDGGRPTSTLDNEARSELPIAGWKIAVDPPSDTML